MRSYDEEIRVTVLLLSCFVFTLFLSVFVSGCSTPDIYTPSPDETYRHDLKLSVNGVSYIGVGVVKYSPQYRIEVTPPGKIDRIMWRTCNREIVEDKPEAGWSNGKYTFVLNPVQGLEDMASCGLQITILEEKKRRNAFAFLEFEDRRQEISLVGQLSCNGVAQNYKGVSVCQAAEGLYQQIQFGTAVVQKGATGHCDVMRPLDASDKTFQFKMPKGDCTYYFVAKEKAPNGRHFAHRLSTKGYTDVPPIKLQ